MTKIWKYELEVTDVQTIHFPPGAQILSVGEQRGKLVLWAMVDSEAVPSDLRVFEVLGTGNPVPQQNYHIRKFLGTVQISHFVRHVFELEKI
jgi:hypothetical protein